MSKDMLTRYVIRIKDPSTNETESEVNHRFISVDRARAHLVDMIVRAKQFPCDVQFTLHGKHCANDEEVYAMIVVYYRKRNERIYYHIQKVEVSKESVMQAQEAEANIADTIIANKPAPNPFDLFKDK